MPKDVKYNMSKSCYLCFEIKRVLVELIVGISQSQNQRKVSCTRAKTYARTTKKSRVYDQTVIRTRAESHVHSSERYRAHEQKVSRIQAKVMRSRERKRLKGQLFFRTVRYSSRIFGNKLYIKRKMLPTSGFFSIKNNAARVFINSIRSHK